MEGYIQPIAVLAIAYIGILAILKESGLFFKLIFCLQACRNQYWKIDELSIYLFLRVPTADV